AGVLRDGDLGDRRVEQSSVRALDRHRYGFDARAFLAYAPDFGRQASEVHFGSPGVTRSRQIVEEGGPIMAGCAEDPAMSTGCHIPSWPRIGLLDGTGGKDLLLLYQDCACLVAASFVRPDPRGDVVDRIDNVLRPVIADHPVRPLGGVATDRQGR